MTDTHTMTLEEGYKIDRQWRNAGEPDDGLRVVTRKNHRVFLLVPGDETAPCYEAKRIDGTYSQQWVLVDGMPLDEWQSLKALQAEYRDEADTEADTLAMLRQF